MHWYVEAAEMYESAIQLLINKPIILREENLDKQRALVERHVRLEESLIKRINEKMPLIQNLKAKFLLNAILSDEKRHHELLKKVLEILVRGATITKEDWWDFLWKNVPFHGAPGG